MLQWAVVPNAAEYQLERSASGQAFSSLFVVKAGTGAVVYSDDLTVSPGLGYQYRVRATFSGGVASDYSPVAQYVATSQAPQIQNLIATVGSAPLPPEDQSGKNYYGVTYDWTRIPDAVSYEVRIEGSSLDPVTGTYKQQFSASYSRPPTWSPPYVQRFEAGTRGRFCVSVIRGGPGATASGETCVTTNTPSPPAPLAPPGSSEPVREVSGAPPLPTVCDPANPLPGRAPASVTVTGQSPVGASVSWMPVVGAVAYALERSAQGSGQWTGIASTCGDSYLQGQLGQSSLSYQDKSGGVTQMASYTYRVRALGANGETGWNTVLWKAPTIPYVSLRSDPPTGSTVVLKWDQRDTDPNTGQLVAKPREFLITSSYGLSLVRSRGSFTGCGCFVEILGVPVGTHTFTVVARYPPDTQTTPRSIGVTIAP